MNIRIPDEILAEGNGKMYEGDQHADNHRDSLFGASNVLGRDSHGTRTSTTRSAISKHLDVEELEMLLEAYFVQIDGTLNQLSTVRQTTSFLSYLILNSNCSSFNYNLLN